MSKALLAAPALMVVVGITACGASPPAAAGSQTSRSSQISGASSQPESSGSGPNCAYINANQSAEVTTYPEPAPASVCALVHKYVAGLTDFQPYNGEDITIEWGGQSCQDSLGHGEFIEVEYGAGTAHDPDVLSAHDVALLDDIPCS